MNDEGSMMLTKEHLKYRVRAGRVHPTLVDAANPEISRTTNRAIEISRRLKGATVQGMLDEMQLEDKLTQAMVQLIVNQSDMDAVEDIAEMRWNWLIAAEEIRQEGGFSAIEEFDREFFRRVEVDSKDGLYSDLPDTAKIKNVRDISAKDLAGFYNLAQIKGLLLRARSVTLTFDKLTVIESRFLFRILKFHQLVAAVTMKGRQLVVELSGSLEVFGVTQSSFGRNIAKFLGYLAKLPGWKLNAELLLKGRNLQLTLDHHAHLMSDHKVSLEYVPEEIANFMSQVRKQLPDWEIGTASEVLNLGGQVYCVPDFSITGPGGESHYIELFHRYHQGQLSSRLAQWIAIPNRRIVLGISTKIPRDVHLETQLNKAKEAGLRTFEFKDFPTARNAVPLLKTESY